MTELPLSTLEKILAAAKAEFLEKGYQSASLRNIVKSAGVTTGAFYGYYSSRRRSCGWATPGKTACRRFFCIWTRAGMRSI